MLSKLLNLNQKADGPYEPQLVINDTTLPPGGEWSPRLPGWLIVHVSRGVGYWLHARLNRELLTGSVMLISHQVQGSVRASQVGELHLQYFRTEPKRLTGLVTMADQKVLESAADDAGLSLRFLAPDAQLSEKFNKLSAKEMAKTLPARTQLLQLFLEVFHGDFQQAQAPKPEVTDAKERLRIMLKETLVDDVSKLDFSELVTKTGCSPRHVSRLFTELVGVSFREKQTELRLARACELLATTDSKVAVVAIESGYQSTSFFNLMFKQRFGMNPTRWREQVRHGKKPVKRILRRWRIA
jgi:AraC-like DNA-binding protein